MEFKGAVLEPSFSMLEAGYCKAAKWKSELQTHVLQNHHSSSTVVRAKDRRQCVGINGNKRIAVRLVLAVVVVVVFIAAVVCRQRCRR